MSSCVIFPICISLEFYKNIETITTFSCCFLKRKRKQTITPSISFEIFSYAFRFSYLGCDDNFYVRYRNHTSHKVAPMPMTRTCGHISSYFGRSIGASFMWSVLLVTTTQTRVHRLSTPNNRIGTVPKKQICFANFYSFSTQNVKIYVLL